VVGRAGGQGPRPALRPLGAPGPGLSGRAGPGLRARGQRNGRRHGRPDRGRADEAVQRADLFPLALCFSGNYDPSSWHAWGERGPAAFANNPVDYVGHLADGHLDWLRSRISLLLVCGQGQWEDTTGALASTRQLAGLLDAQGIRHELDLWGTDVPHGWPSWRAQVARHMPRFC
jgi:S-formylglutathione hydrolase FrmB